MYRFAWSKEVLDYLKDNTGLIDKLELAFADLRNTTTGVPAYGTIDEGIAPDRYIWYIHGHAILIRTGTEDGHLKLWIEAVRPVESESCE